eukprot:11371153-Alexandrium_andersonii.AAC.1
MEGDWKFYKETFGFRAYGHNACCHLCDASKSVPNMWYTRVDAGAPWRSTKITTAEYFERTPLDLSLIHISEPTRLALI